MKIIVFSKTIHPESSIYIVLGWFSHLTLDWLKYETHITLLASQETAVPIGAAVSSRTKPTHPTEYDVRLLEWFLLVRRLHSIRGYDGFKIQPLKPTPIPLALTNLIVYVTVAGPTPRKANKRTRNPMVYGVNGLLNRAPSGPVELSSGGRASRARTPREISIGICFPICMDLCFCTPPTQQIHRPFVVHRSVIWNLFSYYSMVRIGGFPN